MDIVSESAATGNDQEEFQMFTCTVATDLIQRGDERESEILEAAELNVREMMRLTEWERERDCVREEERWERIFYVLFLIFLIRNVSYQRVYINGRVKKGVYQILPNENRMHKNKGRKLGKMGIVNNQNIVLSQINYYNYKLHLLASNMTFVKHLWKFTVYLSNHQILRGWFNTTLLKEGKSIEIQERKTTAKIKGNYFVK